MAWLRLANKDESLQPLDVLGRIIENYLEGSLDQLSPIYPDCLNDRKRLLEVLAGCELRYLKGGKVVGTLGAPSRSLDEYIKSHDIASIDVEFNRALTNVDSSPREAVSAASNILESICKVYIAEEGLEMPTKQDLKSVWAVVRKHLGFDPSKIEDQDLRQILSGLISITEGIGTLRTHASSAHGAGKKSYKLQPRHARLAIHSSHTVALFVLESWRMKAKERR